MELEKVLAYVYPENKGSIRVLEKNGMNRNGEVSEYHFMSRSYTFLLLLVIVLAVIGIGWETFSVG
jgi:RimJ/RimL family protein N-acetyltransferase